MKGKVKKAALVAVLLMLVPVWAMAEGERGTRDITFAVIILGTALLAGMAYLWRRQILRSVADREKKSGKRQWPKWRSTAGTLTGRKSVKACRRPGRS